ncbi:MAG TPA: multidrug effflux MFS transporter [Azospirillum sp.]|nr:multidrug effflux MFS transporter [Azospirillum sp.]
MSQIALSQNLPSDRRLLLIASVVMAFAPLSIDMYLPAFPAIQADFGASSGEVQFTLATFLVGMAVGQLVYGPISDRYGRRRPLMVGITVYVMASAGITLAPDVASLALGRLLQAMGGCAGVVIARAVITDRFEEKAAARAFSIIMLVMNLAPVLAPTIGGQILVLAGWRAIFGVLALFGVLCFGLVLKVLPETLPQERRASRAFMNLGGTIVALVRNRQFLGYALITSLSFSGMFAYIAGSPFVFIGFFGMSPQDYGLLFGMNAVGLILAAQANIHLLKVCSGRTILALGLVLNSVAGIVLLGAALVQPSEPLPLIGALFVVVASLGLIGPNATAAAMSLARPRGTASALIGVMQFGVGGIAGAVIGMLGNGTALPMTVAIAGLSVAGFAALLLTVRPGPRKTL